MQVQLPVWLWVLGRILFVSYFVAMGTSHILKFRDHSAHLARKHVPLPRGHRTHICDDGRWWHVDPFQLAPGAGSRFVLRHHLSGAVLLAPLLERNGLVHASQRIRALH